MSFEATKREWSEIYSLFRLLADGSISMGTVDMQKKEGAYLPIAMIQREEHDGTRSYIIEDNYIHMVGEKIDKQVTRSKFTDAANLILNAIKESTDIDVFCPAEVEAFLDEILIYNLEAKTDDRTDLRIAFYTIDAPLMGVTIRSRMGVMKPLLDGGRTANFKFELQGIKFPTPTVNKINALESANEVADRMFLIERLGGILKYADVTDKVFRSNLQMIDLHFPRLMAEMTRTMHLEGLTKVSELTERMKEINPLKIKDELITKHHFYEYKVKQFLFALISGMRSAKIFNGIDSPISGLIMVDGKGELLCYQQFSREIFVDFLFYNTRLEKGFTEKDKYGYLERENGVYYFKLNLKIGLLKR